MLERALDIVNKWPRDIGDRWRQNLIKDVVSVVVTVVIVNTVKPLPLIPSSVSSDTTCGGAEYTFEVRSAVVLSDTGGVDSVLGGYWLRSICAGWSSG